MLFSISLWDVGMVLGIVAFILLITSEIASSDKKGNLAINKKVLERFALLFGFVFLLIIFVKVIVMIFES